MTAGQEVGTVVAVLESDPRARTLALESRGAWFFVALAASRRPGSKLRFGSIASRDLELSLLLGVDRREVARLLAPALAVGLLIETAPGELWAPVSKVRSNFRETPNAA